MQNASAALSEWEMLMRQFVRILVSVLAATVMTAGVTPAVAQEKAKAPAAEKGKSTRAVLAENDKMKVLEVRIKPGEVNRPTYNASRVVRVLKGGKLLRTYADGKTEPLVWKTGQVAIQEPGPEYTAKNVGKTEIVLYVVVLK
jgi:beta-alanine degradation protein BauB